MKLIRFGNFGEEKPGVLLADGRRADCSGSFSDWDGPFFRDGGLAKLADLLEREGDRLPLAPEDARWGSPVARPGKIMCVGLNYIDHARESGVEPPSEPILFSKATSSLIGPNDTVLIPRGSEKTDWEVELAVIVGAEARYLESEEAAKACVAGFAIANDVSERSFQLERSGQWVKGKSCDTFCPLGPFLATAEEGIDPAELELALDVNGEPRQRGNTSSMIFGPYEIVRYASQFMTLEPGDAICTGTPPGVGMGMKPPTYLKEGDVMELSVQGLGMQRQMVGKA